MSSLPPPPLLSALWRSPCLYTMNTLASTLQNQLSRWEEGKSNLTAATRRGDCFSSRWQRGKHIVPVPQVYWGNKEPNGFGGVEGTVAGLQVSRRSSLTLPPPPSQNIFAFSLSTYLTTHFDTTPITQRLRGLYSSLHSSR